MDATKRSARRKWRGVALVALLAPPAFAAPEHYTIDPDHTQPSFEFSHMGISIWRGKFTRTAGKVVVDRAARTGSAEVFVDTRSIDFGHRGMNTFAASDDWLGVEKYPEMTFKGAIRFAGDKPAAVDGKLTLRDVTRPLSLTINHFGCIPHPLFRKEICGADAEGDFNRADFGMTLYSDGDAGRIHLRIQVEALKD
jgi:polyisoprenoid-binding protein YceI